MSEEALTLMIIVGLVVFFLLLPPKWDPAVLLKEWNEKRKKGQ